MKKFFIINTVCFIFIIGCATVPVRPTIQDTQIINAPFDKVWEALVATLAEMGLPIESIEKESGIVTTDFVIFASGLATEKVLGKVAVYPTSLLYIWSTARYKLSIFAIKKGEDATKVKITTHIEAYESNVTHNWMVCYSKGVIEKRIFESIKMKICQEKKGIIGIFVKEDGYVVQVTEDGPAAKAGLKVGDKIIKINGCPVSELSEIICGLRGEPGTTVEVTVMRNNKEYTFKIVRVRLKE